MTSPRGRALRSQLRARVAATTFVVALLTSGTLTALFAFDAYQARIARLRAEGRRVAFSAVTLYDVLRLTGSEADKATLQAFLSAAVRGTSSEEELAYAVVLDDKGAVVAQATSSRNPSPQGAAPAPGAPCPDGTLCINAGVVGRDTAGKSPDAAAGRVLVGLSTAPAMAALKRTTAVAGGLSALVALLFSGALLSVVSRRVVRPIARVVEGMQAVRAGKLEGVAPVVGADEGAELVDGFNEMVVALASKQATLERHVGKRMTSDISAGDAGRRLRVTALHFDIEGFGARVSRDPPETVVQLLHEVMGACVAIVEEHDGHVSRLMGDTLLAVWGLPKPAEDDALRAVRAAFAMMERCRAVSDERRTRDEEAFTVGIGMATGDAVVATIGSAARAESVVVGEPVALAQRAQEEAKATGFGLLVSAETYGAVRTAFEGAATPPMLLRGFGVPLSLFRVRPRAPSGPPGPLSPPAVT